MFSLLPRFPSFPHFHTHSTNLSISFKMNLQPSILPLSPKHANFTLSSWTIELLEIKSNHPKFHVLLIPGNPGIVSFYKDFLKHLYDLLDGTASVTAIGHIAHTQKNWESGKLFSLQEQIDHKVDFIRQELQNNDIPIVLVGHSIGSYISIETQRKFPEKVIYNIGLYPFLMLNPESKNQTEISKVVESSVLSSLFSFGVASLGLLPRCAQRSIVSNSIGISWSGTAIDAACSHLMQYHTFRNMLFMALTEFRKLSETPDWTFMRENQGKMAFLFGIDDHWGPLQMYEEVSTSTRPSSGPLLDPVKTIFSRISREVPGIALSIEREGHTHSFCCTEAGSLWVAQHVANLIKKSK